MLLLTHELLTEITVQVELITTIIVILIAYLEIKKLKDILPYLTFEQFKC